MIRKAMRGLAARFGYEIKRRITGDYRSETSKCRARLAKFCGGYGLDIGPGGDPIIERAVRVDLESPYASVGEYPVQLGGDASQLVWFRDGVLDFIYSSHVLEDFADTFAVVDEWLRVLKIGGHLVLFCPDEQLFREHCKASGQPYNFQHKHEHFSLESVKAVLSKHGGVEFLHEVRCIDIYSWELVCRKLA